MAVVSIATLKTYFQAGDFPTESQFIDLIDTLASSANTLSVKINGSIGMTVTSTVSGGTAPYSYLWETASDNNSVLGYGPLEIGGSPTGTATTPGLTFSSGNGIARLRVTDANGYIAYAYRWVNDLSA